MSRARRWARAIEEHHAAVADYIATAEGIDPGRWQLAPRPGKWSAAAVTLHVIRSYEFGSGRPGASTAMRLRVPPVVVWIAGHVLLPALLATGRFPRRAESPEEVRPDLAEAELLGQADAMGRLRAAAESALDALGNMRGRPDARVTHAYFGALSPTRALR